MKNDLMLLLVAALASAGCGKTTNEPRVATAMPPSPTVTSASTPAPASTLPASAVDTSPGDMSLPVGTMVVTVVDADERPVAGVTLALVSAEGHKPIGVTESDREGTAIFKRVPPGGSAVLVAVSTGRFAQRVDVPPETGMRVRMHVYPTTTKPSEVQFACKLQVTIERRDRVLHVQQDMDAHVFSQNALLARMTLSLPRGAMNLRADPDSGFLKLSVKPTAAGALLADTFAPGENVASFSWDVPVSTGGPTAMKIGLPPHVAIARVVYSGDAKTSLAAVGFENPHAVADADGRPFWVTEKTFTSDDPLRELALSVR